MRASKLLLDKFISNGSYNVCPVCRLKHCQWNTNYDGENKPKGDYVGIKCPHCRHVIFHAAGRVEDTGHSLKVKVVHEG